MLLTEILTAQPYTDPVVISQMIQEQQEIFKTYMACGNSVDEKLEYVRSSYYFANKWSPDPISLAARTSPIYNFIDENIKVASYVDKLHRIALHDLLWTAQTYDNIQVNVTRISTDQYNLIGAQLQSKIDTAVSPGYARPLCIGIAVVMVGAPILKYFAS